MNVEEGLSDEICWCWKNATLPWMSKLGGNMKNTHTYVNIVPIPLWDLLLEHPAEQTQMEVSLEESLCDTVWGEPPRMSEG